MITFDDFLNKINDIFEKKLIYCENELDIDVETYGEYFKLIFIIEGVRLLYTITDWNIIKTIPNDEFNIDRDCFAYLTSSQLLNNYDNPVKDIKYMFFGKLKMKKPIIFYKHLVKYEILDDFIYALNKHIIDNI